jgi:ubiquinone/menaquinone biosynthesis C-methylase UbiE
MIPDSGFEYKKCLICGSSEYKIIYKGKTNIVKCKNCGLRYSNPAIKENVNNEIISEQGDLDIQRYNALREFQMPRFINELKKIEKIIKPGKILDIGCGNGNFLECAAQRGWETYGIDLNPASFEPCSKHGKIFIGPIQEAKFSDNFFNAIFSSSTFYYVTNPTEFFNELKRILRPGGLAVITGIPNIKSLDVFFKFDSVAIPYPPEQVSYYFRRKDLIKVVFKSGMNMFSLKSSGFGESLRSTTKNDENESNGENAYRNQVSTLSKIAKKNIAAASAKSFMNYVLNIFNLGYHFTLYALKPY